MLSLLHCVHGGPSFPLHSTASWSGASCLTQTLGACEVEPSNRKDLLCMVGSGSRDLDISAESLLTSLALQGAFPLLQVKVPKPLCPSIPSPQNSRGLWSPDNPRAHLSLAGPQTEAFARPADLHIPVFSSLQKEL